MANPAQCLRDFLKRCMDPKYLNLSGRAAWSDLLRVPANDHFLLRRELARLRAAPWRIVGLMARLSALSDLRLYVKWTQEYETLFLADLLNEQFSAFRNRFKESIYDGLAICADLLGEHDEPELDPEQLEKLREEILAVTDTVLKAAIAVTLRDFLLERLYILERALQEYQFLGIEPLASAVSGTLGETLIRHRDAGPVSDETNDEEKVRNGFWKVFSRAAAIVQVSVNLPKLFEMSAKLLGSGEPPTPPG